MMIGVATGVATRDEAAVAGLGDVFHLSAAAAARRLENTTMIEKYPPARECGLIIPAGDNELHPLGIVWIRFRDGRDGGFVPIFTSSTVDEFHLAQLFIREGANADFNWVIAAAKSVDELTSLLTDLKDLGATHVSFNPRNRGNDDLIPIASAIIGIQLAE
jgi:hypothetical protein